MNLFYDTETSGFSENRLLQLAAICGPHTLSVIIKPDGWQIEPGASAVHGITQEQAEREGIPVEAAMWLFDFLCKVAERRVAHNAAYDERVLLREAWRLEMPVREMEVFCTMEASRDLIRIAPTAAMLRAGRRGWKSPSLHEAHVWACGHGFDSAHHALADTRACIRVYEKLLEMQ